MNYDLIIVGSGLTGAMIAWKNRGKKILVLEKEKHIGGFCYTEKWNGIHIHKYGPHIFHTSKKEVWDFVNSICPWKPFTLEVKATNGGEIYSLPFNMNTFKEIWGVTTPNEAKEIIRKQCYKRIPKNLKEKAESQVGTDIFELLIRGYTEKQWQRSCSELPMSIIDRIPVRYSYNNNYFDDTYSGLPVSGYTHFLECLFGDAEIKTGTDFLKNKRFWEDQAPVVYYTGRIDEYYNFQYGELDYREIRHEHKIVSAENLQGCPILNYPDPEVPWTRVIEHKHFQPEIKCSRTWITTEYPGSGLPAYPLENRGNTDLAERYKKIPNEKVIFCGRLGDYKYYDMDDIIEKYYV